MNSSQKRPHTTDPASSIDRTIGTQQANEGCAPPPHHPSLINNLISLKVRHELRGFRIKRCGGYRLIEDAPWH
jgi:hypothetical protein